METWPATNNLNAVWPHGDPVVHGQVLMAGRQGVDDAWMLIVEG
jgi:hypothetical protein